MEWIPKNIGTLLLWLLFLSTTFVIFILYTSNPFSITTKDCISSTTTQNSVVNRTATQDLQEDNQTVLITEVDTQSSSVVQRKPSVSVESSNATSSVVAHAEKKHCDFSKGRWVKDSRGSIYTNSTCATLPDLKNCVLHGKDPTYIYWRWRPESCELPVFDPWKFLQIVRGKKMAFAGDSLARNQMESLLCLLSQAEKPTQTYKDERDKFATWYFPSHDFTLMVIWTEFFVEGIERIVNGTGSNAFEIHLDRINTNWTNTLPTLNYIIISGGNWFFRKNYLYIQREEIGCIFCRERNLTVFGVQFAIKHVLRKALEHISNCQQCEGLLTILRTYTPSHFEHGSWFTGGYCNRTHPLKDTELNFDGLTWDIRSIQVEEIKQLRENNNNNKKKKKKFEVLDVTRAMMTRADGHPGTFWNKKWMRDANDCLHWCLPGPIDMWNDLLLSILQKE